ncbi:unnamed protein product [Soboliphyme baturini]|uniref:Ovule protein n=1 Tax=Soboliphyme baturini TaxID=241478 RepID=A0A183J578_9BILA|nr:unnamed protein product [Soboliphyme baturini]
MPPEYGYNLYPEFRVGYPMPVYSENRHYPNAAATTPSSREANEKREPPKKSSLSPSKLPRPTSYNDWLNKMNPADPHATSPSNVPRPFDADSKPYVTYPNDPCSYYTLNGSTRMGSR